MKIKSKRDKVTPLMIGLLVVLILYIIALFVPLLWGFMTSFKAQKDFRLNIIGLPKEWVWNYTTVFERFYIQVPTDKGAVRITFLTMFGNSMLYSIGCAFAYTATSCMAAYLSARYPYKFGKVIYWTVIITMILPIVGNLPSEVQMTKTLGLFDQMWGAWFLKSSFLGMHFLIFYGMYKALPWAYTEAAQIDGAGNLCVFFKIILPLSINTFGTLYLINFITFWNDYQTPLIYLQHYPTAMTGMYHMAYTLDNEMATVPMRMTATMLVFLPILLVFCVFHKYLMGSITVGGIKG